MRRRILDGCAVVGLLVAAYGIWQLSEPWAFIIVGCGLAIAAELIGTFPRQRGL